MHLSFIEVVELFALCSSSSAFIQFDIWMMIHVIWLFHCLLSSLLAQMIYYRPLFCSTVYCLSAVCMIALSWAKYSLDISYSILWVLIKTDIWPACHSCCQAVRPKRKKGERWMRWGRKVCEIGCSWDLQQNNNCDISISLLEIMCGVQMMDLKFRHTHMHMHAYKMYDSHRTEEGATGRRIYKHPNTHPHTFPKQKIPKMSCSYRWGELFLMVWSFLPRQNITWLNLLSV